jgi:hypothetical protein
MVDFTVADEAADEDAAAPHLAVIQHIYDEAVAQIAGIMASEPASEPSPSREAEGSPDSPADSDPSNGPEAGGSPESAAHLEPSPGRRSDTMRIDMSATTPSASSDSRPGVTPQEAPWPRELEADEVRFPPVASVAAQSRPRRWMTFWIPASTAGRLGSVNTYQPPPLGI